MVIQMLTILKTCISFYARRYDTVTTILIDVGLLQVQSSDVRDIQEVLGGPNTESCFKGTAFVSPHALHSAFHKRS